MTVRTLIMEGESAARERLAQLLRSQPDVMLVAECAHPSEALRALGACRPHLLFLDAESPDLADVAAAARTYAAHVPAPLIVLVSEDDAYPAVAFDMRALDCLVKPVDTHRVERALGRARARLVEAAAVGRSRAEGDGHPGLPCADRIPVRSPGRVFILRPDDIDWLEAAGNYVVVHAGGQSHVIRETITSLGCRLDPARFLRIHRCRIVNMDRIKELHPLDGGEYQVVLHSGARLISSRGCRETLRERLGL